MVPTSAAACCRGGVTLLTRWRCCNLALGRDSHNRKDTSAISNGSSSPCRLQFLSLVFLVGFHQMGQSSEEAVEPEAWVNAFLGRIFWDFLGEKYWANIISKKIQMKLSKIRVRGGTGLQEHLDGVPV